TLLSSGQRGQARSLFKSAYESYLQKEHAVPAIDAAFRQALQGDEKSKQDLYSTLLRQTAKTLAAQDRREAVITLASQCRQRDDGPLADELFELALAKLSDQERLPVTLMGVEYLWQTSQQDRADTMLQKLLADERLSKNAALWRLASQMAGQRKLLKRSVDY